MLDSQFKALDAWTKALSGQTESPSDKPSPTAVRSKVSTGCYRCGEDGHISESCDKARGESKRLKAKVKSKAHADIADTQVVVDQLNISSEALLKGEEATLKVASGPAGETVPTISKLKINSCQMKSESQLLAEKKSEETRLVAVIEVASA